LGNEKYVRVLPVASSLKERIIMSRQLRLIFLPLVGTIVVSLLVGIYLAAGKRRSKSDPVKIIKHSVETPAEDALKYWTADKKRGAKPAPMPNVTALSRKKRQSHQPPDASSSPDA
jgi:hypothetical protein